MKPLVSVIVPMYNAEQHIIKTINSILSQSYENLEVIVVDDLSTDKSYEIVSDIAKKDSRIILKKLAQKGGASLSRNLAIQISRGKYVAFLDADDEWLEDKILKQVNFMEENEVYFSYTNYEIFNIETGEKILSKCPSITTFKSMLKLNKIGCLTVMYNREVVGDVSIPRIDKRNDYALWLSIMDRGVDGYLIDEVLSRYNMTSNSLSRSSSKINLLSYHFKVFNEVMGYSNLKSFLYTIRNGFWYAFKNH